MTDIDKQKRIKELCEKIFKKDVKDIKYCLVTNFIHQSLLEEDLCRTGLYQWISVFRGEVKMPQQIDDYTKYDIIQVNLSGQDWNLISTIKEKVKDSNTLIVANLDYTSEVWGQTYMYPETFGREIGKADMLFGTEKFMRRTLSEITGRRVYELTHPCDTKRLKAIKCDTKEETLLTLYHRYDNAVYLPHFAVRNHGLKSILVGYERGSDKSPYLTSTLYDDIYSATNYQEFCRQLQRSKIIYEPFTFNSPGRATKDTAAMGIPVVGSDRVLSMRKCYPFTICDPYDTLTARKLINKLNTDKKFYDKVVNYAYDAVEFYNLENSMLKYLSALNDQLFNENKEVVKNED